MFAVLLSKNRNSAQHFGSYALQHYGKQAKKLKAYSDEGTQQIGGIFPLGDLGAPAIKGDILSLLKHLRTWFRTDIAVLREEITAVTDRVRATEEDVSSMTQHQEITEQKLQQLQSSHQAMQVRMDVQGDAATSKSEALLNQSMIKSYSTLSNASCLRF
ncbi:Hypothetical predicted protein [Pelobates cultripes]|uniref:Uncharacterized protein n=1 Tax=Pelobates cultripes TaxID=61616 RepID=A0AAD1T280_PELCU|nr:Hypothetical predicted protein [Pelobates cultripes]